MSDRGNKQNRKIQVCLGSSCFSRGNRSNLEAIRKYIGDNGLDTVITLTGCLCQDKCGHGPVVIIDQNTYEDVNLSRLDKILKEEFPC